MVQIIAMAAACSLLNDINTERLTHGLRPLVLDARLASAAAEHALDMARRGYFAHESPGGVSPFDRMRAAGANFDYAGENIALAPDVRQADEALFQSTPHRENTLSPDYRRVGIGIARDANGNEYFVEDFSN